MKNLILTLFVVVSFTTSYGQITAGEVVTGTSIGDPSINIYIDTNISLLEDTSYLDLDCDGTDDLGFVMRKGNMDNDMPNWIILIEVNPDFKACNDSNSVVEYFSLGQTLDCMGPPPINPTYIMVGMFYPSSGEPSVITNKYIHYKKISTNESGWIRIYFDLDEWDGSYPITFDIDEVLYLCPDANLPENQMDDISIFPNPSLDGSIHIEGENSIVSTHVYSLTGELISTWTEVDQLDLPQEKGIYILNWTDVLGNSGYEKVLRN